MIAPREALILHPRHKVSYHDLVCRESEGTFSRVGGGAVSSRLGYPKRIRLSLLNCDLREPPCQGKFKRKGITGVHTFTECHELNVLFCTATPKDIRKSYHSALGLEPPHVFLMQFTKKYLFVCALLAAPCLIIVWGREINLNVVGGGGCSH